MQKSTLLPDMQVTYVQGLLLFFNEPAHFNEPGAVQEMLPGFALPVSLQIMEWGFERPALKSHKVYI